MRRFLLATASVLALCSAPAKADPLSLLVAGASTAQAAATGTLIFGTVGADFAVRAVLGYALNALTTKPASAVQRGYAGNTLGPALPHQIIYGEAVVGGGVFYKASTTASVSNDLYHTCIAFAGHEIDSFQAIYVDGEEVTLDGSGNVTAPAKWVGLIRIKEHLGTDTQAADSDLVSEVTEWKTAHQSKGVAYLYCRFKGLSNFPDGVPVVTAKIRGKKVEDPRTGLTVWSDNPALCIRDYLLSPYGLSESTANIDDTLFEAAADACEVVVSGSDKYTCNGSFLLDAAPEDIIRSILSAMGGTFWNYAGTWAVRAAEYEAPTITLTEDDILTPLTVATRHSRRDNFNEVHGTYRGAETNWQVDDYGPVRSGLYIREDNDIPAITDLALPFTDTNTMAQRIARTFLRRNRRQITCTAGFGIAALALKIGDTVDLSVDHLSWSSKVFEVVDWRLGNDGNGGITINMILREMSEEVFTGVVDTLTDESGNVLTDESGNILEAIVA